MIEKQVTIYRCGFCNKLYLKKAYCERHENICGKNKINWRDCFECPHLQNKTGETPTNLYYGPEMKTVKFLFCEKKRLRYTRPRLKEVFAAPMSTYVITTKSTLTSQCQRSANAKFTSKLKNSTDSVKQAAELLRLPICQFVEQPECFVASKSPETGRD